MVEQQMNGFLAGQRLLVIAVHPDDEVLGCGGIIKKVKALGGEVFVLYVTVGPSPQYDHVYKNTVVEQRLSEIAQVTAYLGVDDYEVALIGEQYHLRLNAMPQQYLVDLIEKGDRISLNKIKPTIVALPSPHHYHQDHRAVFEAAFAACRPVPRDLKPFQDTVLCYEQPCYNWSPDRLQPNFYVDISDHLVAKLHAITLHGSQNRAEPFIRSVENLRRLSEARGREIGVQAAEAFICYRFVA